MAGSTGADGRIGSRDGVRDDFDPADLGHDFQPLGDRQQTKRSFSVLSIASINARLSKPG
jgi:hypothetical protein